MSQMVQPESFLREADVSRVKEYIREITEHSFAGTSVGDVLDDVLRSTGKMIRPRLLLLCAGLGPDYQEHYENLCLEAAMVELTHIASLVHDDIVDDAPFRRGLPSIQGKYGKDAAVYAGDFLIARVNRFEAERNLSGTASILSDTMEHMCIGEIGQSRIRYHLDVTKEDYLENIKGKTAYLFRAACLIGARGGGLEQEDQKALSELGCKIGIMFQLRDDLLDFTSSTSKEGKQTHKDFHDGIYTMPLLMALESEGGREELLPMMEKNQKCRLSDEEILQMEDAVRRHGGISATVDAIHLLYNQCIQLLNQVSDEGTVGSKLRIQKLLERLQNG
ncbi:MAG: polyprenyl synthetase family protein [Lachnospiraceae bacterium]|nr:polyprenyl synthetase family protein [Lachnospiraceae bacterium]